MSAKRQNLAEFSKTLGANYVCLNGDYVHVSRLPAGSPRPRTQNTEVAVPKADRPILGPESERSSKPTDPEHEDILGYYARAYAALVVLNFKTKSANELKWRHWTHHLQERKRTGAKIETSAFWKVPLGGTLPQPLTQKIRQEIAFIRYGGRRIDSDNLSSGLKSVRDQITKMGFIIDDSITWLKAHYAQIPGGEPKLEILFLNDPRKTHPHPDCLL